MSAKELMERRKKIDAELNKSIKNLKKGEKEIKNIKSNKSKNIFNF